MTPDRPSGSMADALVPLTADPNAPRAGDPTATNSTPAAMLTGAPAEELHRIATSQPVGERTAGPVERVAKWVRRRPTLAMACVFALMLVLLGVGTSLVVTLWQRATRDTLAAVAARENEQQANQLAEKAEASRDNARKDADHALDAARAARDDLAKAQEELAAHVYGRTMQVAHQEWRENNIAAALARLEGTRSDLRGWEWRYVHRLCHSDLLTLKGHTDGVRSATFSADGTRIVTASLDGTAKVWDATPVNLQFLRTESDLKRSPHDPVPPSERQSGLRPS